VRLAGGAGLLGSGLVVASAGRLGPRNGSVPPRWWGGLSKPVAEFASSPLPALMVGGVALLLIGWCLLTASAAEGSIGPRAVVAVTALWAAPILAGPPLLSLDVYSYAAHGAMVAAGLDPYRSGPLVLGTGPAIRAADPAWLTSPAPYGPLALGLTRAVTAGTGRSLLAFVLVMRLIAALSVVCVGFCLARLVPPARRAGALALAVANPITLLHLVGAIHLEAVMMALAALGLALTLGRPPAGDPAPGLGTVTGPAALAGLVALTAAACVKWPAALIVAAVAVSRARRAAVGQPRPGRPAVARLAVARLAVDLAVVAAAFALFSLAVPDGLGWVRAGATPTAGLTLSAPTTSLAFLGALGLTSTGYPTTGAELVGAARAVGLAGAAATAGWLLATGRRRDVAATAGIGLFALAVLGPVVYPWYFAWSIVPLAASRERSRWLIIVPETVVGSFLALPHCELLFADHPGFATWFANHGPLVALAVLVLAIVLTVLAGRGLVGRTLGGRVLADAGTPGGTDPAGEAI
jgi:alpha-1,6-mannosyltransferase